MACSRQNLESQKEDVKASRLTAALCRTVGFLIATSTALVLWYGGWLVLAGELTPGELLVFLAYLKSAAKPMQEFGKYMGRIAKATGAGERVLDLLDRTPEVRDLPGAVVAPPLAGRVRFDGVRFAYEPDQHVLEHVDFDVSAGQRVALVGPSGIGKSTLANLLLRLYDPREGRVLIDDRDIREYTLVSLRSQLRQVGHGQMAWPFEADVEVGKRPHLLYAEFSSAGRLSGKSGERSADEQSRQCQAAR